VTHPNKVCWEGDWGNPRIGDNYKKVPFLGKDQETKMERSESTKFCWAYESRKWARCKTVKIGGRRREREVQNPSINWWWEEEIKTDSMSWGPMFASVG